MGNIMNFFKRNKTEGFITTEEPSNVKESNNNLQEDLEDKPLTHVEEYYLEKTEKSDKNLTRSTIATAVLLTLFFGIKPLLGKIGIDFTFNLGDYIFDGTDVVERITAIAAIVSAVMTLVNLYKNKKYNDVLDLYHAEQKDREELQSGRSK